MTIGKAFDFPCRTVVFCFHQADAGIGGTRRIVFTGSYPEGACGPMHGHLANVLRGCIFRDGGKANAVVGGMPHPARGIGHVELGRVLGVDCQGNHPPTHDFWTDIFKRNVLHQRRTALRINSLKGLVQDNSIRGRWLGKNHTEKEESKEGKTITHH